MAETDEWQCVMICWGTRYPVEVLNHLVATIRAQAARAPRFMLITEAPKPGLDPNVTLLPFPDFFLRDRFRRSGCQAKLAMFEVVPGDLPAVYVDLDTVVTGDLGRGVALMAHPRSVLMLQSAIVPFGPLGRLVHRLSGGRRYARGNSSVVVWHPAEGRHIAQTFRRLDADHPEHGDFRPMIADERFISWCAQADMTALPRDFAVKFTWEYMMPWLWPQAFRARLPWVRARRAAQAAVTLNGNDIKPEVLLDLCEGARLRDRKGRWLIWSDRIMGPARARILAHCRATVLPQPPDPTP